MSARERTFRLLLRLYPAGFRRRYGDEMLQLCADQMRDARTAGTPRGAVQALLGTMIDVVWCGLGERLVGTGQIGPTPLARSLGLIGLVGGLLFVSAFAFAFPGASNTTRLVLFNAGAIAVAIGVFSHLPGPRPRWAALLVGLVIVANMAYAVGVVYSMQFERPFAGDRGVVFSWLGHALWLADSLFAIVVLRLGGIARVGALALALGGFTVLGIVPGLGSFWEPDDLILKIALGGVALNGLGWVVLGLVVAFRGRAPELVTEVSQPA